MTDANGRPTRMKRKPSPARAQQLCDDWNAKHPEGTAVYVRRDTGHDFATATRSEAYVDANGYPVIFLRGISGYYLLDRVRLPTDKPLPEDVP
jgi:hypothetical protein